MTVNFLDWSSNFPGFSLYSIPTYGRYGGPQYTAGVIGGTDFSVPPVDALDNTFRTHDMAYSQADAVEQSDPILARQIRSAADAQQIGRAHV